MIYIPNYYVRLLGFFAMGLFQIKISTCYMYICELVEQKHKSSVIAFINAIDGFTHTIVALYFKFFSKDWNPLFMGSVFVSTIALIGMLLFAPESPKWLIVNNRKQEAVASLNYISKFNRSNYIIDRATMF